MLCSRQVLICPSESGKVLFHKPKISKVDTTPEAAPESSATPASSESARTSKEVDGKAAFGARRPTKPKTEGKVELSKALGKKNTALLSFTDDEEAEE